MIIYPPYIADTIPGFVSNELIIPYQQNPAVGVDQVAGMKVYIKNYNGNTDIAVGTTTNIDNNMAIFTAFEEPETETAWTPTADQYYKFQIAYIENGSGDEGTRSTASIGKCIGTQKPNVAIYNGDAIISNEYNNIGIYTGKCVGLSSLEPIYSYRFICSNGQDTGEILYTSGDMQFKLNFIDTCTLQFQITTINGYVGVSPEYTIIQENLDEETTGDISCLVEADNGYIIIKTENCEANAKYILERTVDKIHYEELLTFDTGSIYTDYQWRDFSVEQGMEYYYSIRELNADGTFAAKRKFTTNNYSIDFEDIFLSDCTGKQLRVRFDPKVSSFKDTILEAKIETIGSKYPFFFRNGNVRYKELPIAGLISYNMDADGLFMSDNDLGFEYEDTRVYTELGQTAHKKLRSTSLSGENITAERKFKLAVMDWLNNGQPKLYRSPTEGNYVVRLMNVTLSPNDTLGRMLHSFSATGYEVSDQDLQSLIDQGIIDPQYTPQSRLGYFVLGVSVLGGNA